MTIVTLVGCGKMGSAMVRGWVASKVADTIYVIEPSGLPGDLQNMAEVELVEQTLPSDIIVLAVKPQMMDAVCRTLAPGTATILSIAAGQKIANFEKYFGDTHPVIRAMPNTPAAIGEGMTVAVANKNVTPGIRNIADRLLRATGRVEWIDDETLMDAVTALSGSGPAYVFYLIEVLAKAGEASGLAPVFAMSLARQTVIGSAALAGYDAETPAETLRQNVTSPGGTTEAALNVLMDGRMQDLFSEALNAATSRSKELSK
ncbi:MAG: proC [Micavibrio sp.]|nr:proC [Micavibrio sp.]